jgi:hypothetical protein
MTDDVCGDANACVLGACYPGAGKCTVIITATP